MNGRHEAFDNAELLVQDLGEGSQAVGRAGRIGKDSLARVGRVVDTHDKHRLVVVKGKRQRDKVVVSWERFVVRYSTVATTTDRRTASADGAEMMTRFAPPFKCAEAFSMVVKTPVDSQTVSAPACPQGMSVGSRREEERKVVKDKREEGESLKGSKILPMRTHEVSRPDAQRTK
jgi:hypothetical protein